MGGDVVFPDAQGCGVNLADEQGAFEGGVIARDHGKAVERQDIAALQFAVGDGVMGAIGVEAGLEPDPGIAVFGIGKMLGDFAFHRVTPGDGNLKLGHAFAYGVAYGIAAYIGDVGPVLDKGDFSGGFQHALVHGGRGDVHAALGLQEGVEFLGTVHGKVVGLTPHSLARAGDRGHGAPEIVTGPVGVGDVVFDAAAPGLACVNAGADGDALGGGDDAGIGTAKGAVEEAGVISDVMHGGEDDRIELVEFHDVAEA
jgi:hypothetical protein